MKAESKFQFSLKENEDLKAKFAMKRAAWDSEKAAFLKCAEDVEAQLKPVTDELAGFKQ